jgi:hypothetical protein
MTGPGAPVSERLELRLNWLALTGILLASVICFAVGAVAWLDMRSGSHDAWPLAAAGLLLSLVGLAAAVRYRLILTPEGFRTRFLWNGRLVRWSSVRRFEADVLARGIWWLPQDRPAIPKSVWRWATAIRAAGRRHIALFGPSTADLLATMNEWLNRYSASDREDDSVERLEIIVDDQRLLLENPQLHSRLQQFQRRHQTGEDVNLAELDRLLKDLAPWSSRSEEGKS